MTLVRDYLGERSGKSGCHGGGLSFCIAFVIARIGLVGWPPFPPVEATQWLVFLVPVLGCVGFLETRMTRKSWIVLLRFLVSLASVGLLLKARADHAWSLGEYLIWILGGGGAVLVVWSFVAGVVVGFPRSWNSLPLVAVLGGESVILALSGSALLAQLCGAGSVALFALSATRKTGRWMIPGDAVAPVLWLGSILLILGNVYAYLPLVSGLLVLLALCSPVMWRFRPFRAWEDTRILSVNLVVIVAIFVLLVWLNWPEKSDYGSAW